MIIGCGVRSTNLTIRSALPDWMLFRSYFTSLCLTFLNDKMVITNCSYLTRLFIHLIHKYLSIIHKVLTVTNPQIPCILGKKWLKSSQYFYLKKTTSYCRKIFFFVKIWALYWQNQKTCFNVFSENKKSTKHLSQFLDCGNAHW